MRLILVGGRSFARAALAQVLGDGHEVAAVWTDDDSLEETVVNQRSYKSHTGNRLTAVWRGQVEPYFIERCEADLLVSVHNHTFIPALAREATKEGAIGYHPSLLPRHRGIDAVRWTIHDKDPIAGGSVYWLDDGIDTGPVAKQDWCHVKPGWSASDLWREELFPMGLRLLSETLREIEGGTLTAIDQDESVATYEPPWREEHPAPEPEVQPDVDPMNTVGRLAGAKPPRMDVY